MNIIDITLPLDEKAVSSLKAGDRVRLSGWLYTARDAAHARLIRAIEEGNELPLPLQGETIYYVGPTPAKPGQVIGSAGPTTSSRMDSFTPVLLSLGLKGMIGKGKRSPAVIEAMKNYGAVYFAAVGGAAVTIAESIQASEVVAYEDLGSEAIRRLKVQDFPAVVVIDGEGNNWYELGPQSWKEAQSKQ